MIGAPYKLAQAEAMLREVLQTQQRELGHHHAYTMATVRDLVDVLNAGEEFEEAQRLARDIIPFLRHNVGEEGVDRLQALNGLALALHGLGRLEEAEVIFREVLETSQRVFTTGLLSLPAFQAHFGRCLTDLNRFEEAEPQLRTAYEGERTMRGEAHKNTGKVMEHLAHRYEMWDKPEQATPWRAKLSTAKPAPGPNGQQP